MYWCLVPNSYFAFDDYDRVLACARSMAAAFKRQVGARLRQLLEERAMSPTDLAAATGIPRSTIYNIQSGRHFPRADRLNRIATKLRIDELDLLCFPDAGARHKLIDRLRGAPASKSLELLALVDEPPPPQRNRATKSLAKSK
jgi:transcriptional regulator with XRE-family HTH domain